MSAAPKQPLSKPTVRGVLTKHLGAEVADQAIDALTLHLSVHYCGGDAPGIVLRKGHLEFIELLRPRFHAPDQPQ